MTTRQWWIMMAAGGSALLLIGAFAFQHLGGMAPCKLCIWQRWPHVIAIALGVIALMLPGRVLPLAGALAALGTAGIGFYHTGVERGWWEGPTSCTSSGVSGVSTDDLFDQIMAAPLIRCDEVPWDMLGLSMASWNGLISLLLVFFWLKAVRAPTAA
ncbi:disulfide bond formation protein B [uncultured Roseovarius sp.]|uniref:disulfide bond formation protein B n=1 Tax=uncultured Roseovarius sp. TaxID=293344 RepID=UPI00261324E3|nr:disulfide bond formation protein B [uncultured Roseovarius sp.]